jgi:glucose-1-phosphate adenylyltransferase
MVIGEDPQADGQRFERTENGVVLVTRSMLEKLQAKQDPLKDNA